MKLRACATRRENCIQFCVPRPCATRRGKACYCSPMLVLAILESPRRGRPSCILDNLEPLDCTANEPLLFSFCVWAKEPCPRRPYEARQKTLAEPFCVALTLRGFAGAPSCMSACWRSKVNGRWVPECVGRFRGARRRIPRRHPSASFDPRFPFPLPPPLPPFLSPPPLLLPCGQRKVRAEIRSSKLGVARRLPVSPFCVAAP